MSFGSASVRIRVVVAVRTASLLGELVAAIALTLRFQAAGLSPAWVAALLIGALLPVVVLAPLVGRLADGADTRWLLLASGLGQAVACAALATGPAPAVTVGLAVLLGLGQAVNGTSWTVLLTRVAGRDALPSALGLSQAGATVAAVAAPALAGLLTGAGGTRWALLLAVAVFGLVTLATPALASRAGPVDTSADLADGGATAVRDPLLRLLLALLALFVTLGAMVNVVEVYLVRGTLHASPTAYGLVGTVFALGMLAGALGAGRLTGDVQLAGAFVGGAVVLAVAMTAMALVPSVGWLLPASAALGAGNGALNVGLDALVMRRAPESARGRVAAALGAVASGAAICAYLLGGLLSAALTPRQVLLLAGALGILTPVLLGARVVRAAASAPDGALR